MLFQCDTKTAIVDTSQGKVQGYVWNDLLIFKGIPYARARRFHRPEAYPAWQGILNCTNYGKVAPLIEEENPSGELLVPHRYWPTDEHCQNLNIWTPGTDDKKRPVLFWLHGGGYDSGSAIEQVAYDGFAMASYGDVVVVTVNHRLNLLGYLDLSDFGQAYENSGNAGTEDIIFALRWVVDNIAFFGGDPENITVFGQSGGGGKLTTLLQSPQADGLFQKGINMSGVVGTLLPDNTESGEDLAKALFKELRIHSVAEMEEIDFYLLAKAYKRVKTEWEKANKKLHFAPHPNRFYAGDPLRVGFRQESKEIPLIVGSVFGEFTSFVPSPYHEGTEEDMLEQLFSILGKERTEKLLPLFKAAYPKRPIIDLLKIDYLFREPARQYIEARSQLGSPTWSYLFDMDQKIFGRQTPWHCCDIPFAFHNVDLVEYPNGNRAPAKQLEKQIFASVIAFARDGNPNHAGFVEWPKSMKGKEYTMCFNENTQVKVNFDHQLMKEVIVLLAPLMQEKGALPKGDIQH